MLGTDFLNSWSLMWDSEELQTIVSQTEVLVKQSSVRACACTEVCWLFISSKQPPIDQSYSNSLKKQLKGSRAWLWCLVGNSITVLAPQPVLGCRGCRASPAVLDTAPSPAQSLLQWHRPGITHVPCLTLGQGRSQLNRRDLNASGFGALLP